MKTTVVQLLLIAALLGPASPAAAELKDFQVARLIFFKSECILVTLVRTENSDGSWSFHGTCSNETFYPDGIRVDCPDPDNNDEHFCKILTARKQYPNLDMLRQHGND